MAAEMFTRSVLPEKSNRPGCDGQPLESYHEWVEIRVPNPQWRAFRPREVAFNDSIHTPGFVLRLDSRAAGRLSRTLQLDHALIPQRLENLRNYERQREGAIRRSRRQSRI
jgi:hypothetical protein